MRHERSGTPADPRVQAVSANQAFLGQATVHFKNKHKDQWDSFVVFRLEDVTYLKDIETLLLRVANPPGNSVSGHFHRDADLTKVIRKIQGEQMRKLKHIRKVLR